MVHYNNYSLSTCHCPALCSTAEIKGEGGGPALWTFTLEGVRHTRPYSESAEALVSEAHKGMGIRRGPHIPVWRGQLLGIKYIRYKDVTYGAGNITNIL